MRLVVALLLVPVLFLLACSSAESGGKAPAQTGLPEGAKLIDVRTPGEYGEGHVKGAINVPVDEVEKGIAEVAPDKSAEVCVYCRSGGRSARAKERLEGLGYKHVTDLGSLANARKTVEGK